MKSVSQICILTILLLEVCDVVQCAGGVSWRSLYKCEKARPLNYELKMTLSEECDNLTFNFKTSPFNSFILSAFLKVSFNNFDFHDNKCSSVKYNLCLEISTSESTKRFSEH